MVMDYAVNCKVIYENVFEVTGAIYRIKIFWTKWFLSTKICSHMSMIDCIELYLDL